MPRYFIPIHFAKTKKARYKAKLDTFKPYTIVAVEAPSAAAAAHLVAARIMIKDNREVSLRKPGSHLTPEAWKDWFLAQLRTNRALCKHLPLYGPLPTEEEAWAEWVASIERKGIWAAINQEAN